ncbi:MAG: DUF1080 domain-containing protein, partial [Bacteroidales bacterium]|nr:DUF1080 domain-containing protein [Bacteroidales bacterium]
MKLKLFLTCMVILFVLSGCRKSDWQKLFNGRDFSGFVQLGGQAQYIVEDEVMVGIS